MKPIIYQTTDPMKSLKKYFNTLRFGLGPETLFITLFLFIYWALFIKLEGFYIAVNLNWILKKTLLSFIFFTIASIIIIAPLCYAIAKKKYEKKKSPVQKHEFQLDGIAITKSSEHTKISYQKIGTIILFSDIIVINKKIGSLMVYQRHSFINATEEEWLAFMKERNPKIKVKYLKNDYIRF